MNLTMHEIFKGDVCVSFETAPTQMPQPKCRFSENQEVGVQTAKLRHLDLYFRPVGTQLIFASAERRAATAVAALGGCLHCAALRPDKGRLSPLPLA